MENGRYYPTQVELGNGSVALFSGTMESGFHNDQIEIYHPDTDELELLPDADHFSLNYPAKHLLPDGRVIHRTAKNAHTDSWGVTPDVEVTLSDDEVHAIQESRWALDVAFVDPTTRSATNTVGGSDSEGNWPPPREILRDRQLVEALQRIRRQLAEHRLAE